MAIPQNVPQHTGLNSLTVLFVRRLTPVIFVLFFLAVVAALLNYLPNIETFFNLTPRAYQIVYGIISFFFLIAAAASLVAIFFVFLFTIIQYYFYTFILGDFSFNIIKGIFFREDTSISYRQIRNVDLEQPLLFILLKVSKMTILMLSNAPDAISNGGVRSVEIILDANLAEELQDILVRRSNVSEVIELPANTPRIVGNPVSPLDSAPPVI